MNISSSDPSTEKVDAILERMLRIAATLANDGSVAKRILRATKEITKR